MPIWIHFIEWFARIILLILVCLSIWSWAVILDKYRFFKWIESLDSLDKIKNKILEKNFTDLENGFRSGVLKVTQTNSDQEKIKQLVNAHLILEKRKLETGLPVLSTLGSSTPFIGLLGTIMGIIVSFAQLSLAKGDMNMVMFSLAEALILTAFGLFVAIPAVVAFNYFSKKVRYLMSDAEAIVDFYLANK